MGDKPVSLYMDCPSWYPEINVDDFIVTIGKNKSNSVYHVCEVKATKRTERIIRFNLKAYRSDLITALKRSETQRLITMTWYKR